MTKLLKILGNTLHIIMEIVFLVLIVVLFLIRTPSFQTFLAHQGTQYLSNYLKAEVSIDKIDIAFFDRVYFDDLLLKDQQDDTLAYIKECYVNYDLARLKWPSLYVDKVQLNEVHFNLKKSKGDTTLNLQFLVDAFRSNDTTSPIFDIKIGEVDLNNASFSYDDQNEKSIPYGVDFNHLNLKKIRLEASTVHILPKTYTATIRSLGFVEQSGFDLQKLSGEAKFSEKGLTVKRLIVQTKNSDLSLPSFSLQTPKESRFDDFVEKVGIVSQIDTSTVNMKDIAYFAPQLRGMNDGVIIAGSTKNPVDSLKMEDIYLKYGKGTVLKGHFSLPDFRKLNTADIHQNIEYLKVYVSDLKQFNLPHSKKKNNLIPWPKSLDGVKYIETSNLRLKGKLHQLDVQLKTLKTNIGQFNFYNKIRVISDSNFSRIKAIPKGKYYTKIAVTNLNINSVTDNDDIGPINGTVFMHSFLLDKGKIAVSQIKGEIRNMEVFGYPYDFILLDSMNYSFYRNRLNGKNQIAGNFYVRDDNLDLDFHGKIGVGNGYEINSNINIECANLPALHSSLKDYGDLVTRLRIDMHGEGDKKWTAEAIIDTLSLKREEKSFTTTDFRGYIAKINKNDTVRIRSSIFDVDISGHFTPSAVKRKITRQLSKLLPIIHLKNPHKEIAGINHFSYAIHFKKVNPLLSFFVPDLRIADNTIISGQYKGEEKSIELNINADSIYYKSMKFEDIAIHQNLTNQELWGLINIQNAYLNDSLSLSNVHFTGLASEGTLDAQVLFKNQEGDQSNIQWLTKINGDSTMEISFFPSSIFLGKRKWDIDKKGSIRYSHNKWFINDFKMSHYGQTITANGILSPRKEDKLFIDLMKLDLNELTSLFGGTRRYEGKASVTGYITSPFNNFHFFGESIIKGLKVNNTRVGNVSFGMNYEEGESNIKMFGDIYRQQKHTYHFDGNYLVGNKGDTSNRLDFDMQFKSTDFSVVSEFLDSNVIDDLEGNLYGKIHLSGTIEKPVINGELYVNDGIFNLALLGANMYISGAVEFDKNKVTIPRMTLTDEEGNKGYVTGTINYHYFHDFHYNITVNLGRNPFEDFMVDPTEQKKNQRFLVMRTTYNVDKPYYGDAYITGIATITGHGNSMKINVNATTQKGTKLVIPLYGPTTIEKEGFITFKKREDTTKKESKIDFSGVDMTLHIQATNEAQVKLIFDKAVGDEISARGNGNIELSMGTKGQLSMEGVYTVSSGVYNFAMGPYKQDFIIRPGGTVQWSGDLYDALLHLQAYYKTRANLSVVMPNVIESNTGQSTNTDIYANLAISGEMMNPTIKFDLTAPQASDMGKAILSRIRSDKDELNRQFFSILVTKSFLPLSGTKGSGTSGSNALLNLASTQINSLLNQVTHGYDMNVQLNNDKYSGEFSGELGLSKSFLDNRLLLSGSFGIGSTKEGQVGGGAQNRFIGDVKLEYLLNQRGTFRLSVFNRSNDYTILQDEGRGQFTQGIGISYHENFHTLKDFQLYQSIINLFRKDKNEVHIHKKDKRVPIPDKYYREKGLKEKEN